MTDFFFRREKKQRPCSEMADPAEAASLDLEEEGAPPTGLTHALLQDRLFQQACRNEGITLDELRAADALSAQIGKVKRLHESGSLSADEYSAKVFELLGAGPEAINATLERYNRRHAGLVQTVLDAMGRLKDDMDEQLPVPPGIDEEVFFSEHFQKACDLIGVTLKDVCKFERTRADYARFKRLRTDERISDEEYAAKVERLFGVPEHRADEALSGLHNAQLELIEQLVASAQKIKHAEWEAEQQAAIARKKQEDYVAELNRQVEQKIAQARRKAQSEVARQRAALEKVLIRRGVEGVVREVVSVRARVCLTFATTFATTLALLRFAPTYKAARVVILTRCRQEKVDRYLATPYLRKKAPPDVGMIPKTTAGMERKKLWLIERNSKAQAKTRPTLSHAGGNQQQEASQNSDSLQPQRALTPLEKRELLLQEKAEQIKMKESRFGTCCDDVRAPSPAIMVSASSCFAMYLFRDLNHQCPKSDCDLPRRKLHLQEMQMKENESNLRKKRQLSEKKQIQKETAVVRLQIPLTVAHSIDACDNLLLVI